MSDKDMVPIVGVIVLVAVLAFVFCATMIPPILQARRKRRGEIHCRWCDKLITTIQGTREPCLRSSSVRNKGTSHVVNLWEEQYLELLAKNTPGGPKP